MGTFQDEQPGGRSYRFGRVWIEWSYETWCLYPPVATAFHMFAEDEAIQSSF